MQDCVEVVHGGSWGVKSCFVQQVRSVEGVVVGWVATLVGCSYADQGCEGGGGTGASLWDSLMRCVSGARCLLV